MEKKGYWSPYIAGVGLGLTLLASYLLMAKGLGASRGLTIITSQCLNVISPESASGIKYFGSFLEIPSPFLTTDVIMLLGVFLGALAGALSSGSFKVFLDKGASSGTGARFAYAIGGGILVGFGARLARGCSSGLALSGSAFLSLGGWLFLIGMFAGGFIAAFLLRRLWS